MHLKIYQSWLKSDIDVLWNSIFYCSQQGNSRVASQSKLSKQMWNDFKLIDIRRRQHNFLLYGIRGNCFGPVGRENINNNRKFQGRQILQCQYKFHMKPTTFLYSMIQQCQMSEILVLYVFYGNLKEKDHIRRYICEISIFNQNIHL